MNTNELVNDITKGDNVKAKSSFDTVMGEKLKAALDANKIEIASSMGKQPEEMEEQEVEIDLDGLEAGEE